MQKVGKGGWRGRFWDGYDGPRILNFDVPPFVRSTGSPGLQAAAVLGGSMGF
jgi:hypothetical protein